MKSKPPITFIIFVLGLLIDGVEPQTNDAKAPAVHGLRVEFPMGDPFGYDKHGVGAVPPDLEFKMVVYGEHLDRIDRLAFTVTDNCSDAAVEVVPSTDFIQHFENKASFHLSLPAVPAGMIAYKMCVKAKGVLFGSVSPLDDASTWLTTEQPPKQYLLPLPVQIAVIAFMLCLSALFSGLTLGLMSLTPFELELVQKCGSKDEQKYAAKILPIRRKGNLLLCSLLLGNVIVNASISILFGELTSGLLALAISSLGIVVFGEILPQSICVKKGLAVGAHTIAITQFFIFLTFPIAWPISKLLDCLLGEEYTGYDRKRLMELMKMSLKENGDMSDELKIAVGAMEIADKTVADVMTKVDDIFMLPSSTVLNAKTIAEIMRLGYSRIPVCEKDDRNEVTSLLNVKDLALIDPDDNFTVATVVGYHNHPVKWVGANTPLAVVLEHFKKGEGHLAMVNNHVIEPTDKKNEVVGLVTLEDIVEEILQAEIVDEFDTIIDNKTKSKMKRERKNDLSRFFEREAPQEQVSSHLQMITMQFLVSNEEAFRDYKYINQNVLRRLISTSVKRVDMSYLMTTRNEAIPLPKLAKLFTKGELSDRYILVLEGRVRVKIGQSDMAFEAGPFQSFGQELLEKLLTEVHTRKILFIDSEIEIAERRSDLIFTPDYEVTITDDCTYLEITAASFLNACRSSLMMLKEGTTPRVSADVPPIDLTPITEESVRLLAEQEKETA